MNSFSRQSLSFLVSPETDNSHGYLSSLSIFSLSLLNELPRQNQPNRKSSTAIAHTTAVCQRLRVIRELHFAQCLSQLHPDNLLCPSKTSINPVVFGETQKTWKLWSVLKFSGKVLTKMFFICKRGKRISWHKPWKTQLSNYLCCCKKKLQAFCSQNVPGAIQPCAESCLVQGAESLHSHRLFWASSTSQEEVQKWCCSPETKHILLVFPSI